MPRLLQALSLVVCLGPAASARGVGDRPVADWPDNFVSRLAALALLETLNADLLSHDSATLTLDRWCETHRLATPPRIVADLSRGAQKAPTAEQLRLLAVSEAGELRYRRVQLRCGGHVLSEADNWYVAARLTPGMNQQLDTTDIAFGRAIQALRFHRRTLSARLLWQPLPQGWEMDAARPDQTSNTLRIPPFVLEHRAVLSLADGTPVSEVVETYTGAVLAFPAPNQNGDANARR